MTIIYLSSHCLLHSFNPQKHNFVDDFRRWPWPSYSDLVKIKQLDSIILKLSNGLAIREILNCFTFKIQRLMETLVLSINN